MIVERSPERGQTGNEAGSDVSARVAISFVVVLELELRLRVQRSADFSPTRDDQSDRFGYQHRRGPSFYPPSTTLPWTHLQSPKRPSKASRVAVSTWLKASSTDHACLTRSIVFTMVRPWPKTTKIWLTMHAPLSIYTGRVRAHPHQKGQRHVKTMRE